MSLLTMRPSSTAEGTAPDDEPSLPQMMDYKRIGSALGREVRYLSIPALPTYWELSLADTTVLIWFDQARLNRFPLSASIASLLRASPLAVMTGGPASGDLFDILLNRQGWLNLPDHTMTRSGEGMGFAECVSELFDSVWPADERWDAWKAYLIITVGTRSRQEEVLSLADGPQSDIPTER